jgi:hypothetical protein
MQGKHLDIETPAMRPLWPAVTIEIVTSGDHLNASCVKITAHPTS